MSGLIDDKWLSSSPKLMRWVSRWTPSDRVTGVGLCELGGLQCLEIDVFATWAELYIDRRSILKTRMLAFDGNAMLLADYSHEG